MKNILTPSLKLLLLCAAAATLGTLGGGHARAQVTFRGSTVGSTFTDFTTGGQGNTLGGLTFRGSDFGGTTRSVLFLNQENNNLGTLTFTPEGGELFGGFDLQVRFDSPTGFNFNPVILGGTVFGFGSFYDDPNNYAIIDFPNDTFSVFFDGADGTGLFSFRLDDACLSGGQPCSFPRCSDCPPVARSLQKSPSSQIRRAELSGGGNVSWLKARGTRSMFAPGLSANTSLSALAPVTITLTGTITVAPTQGCVHGQGYYLNTPGAIPRFSLGQSSPSPARFRLTLGTVAYDQTQLLAILAKPVGKNGGLLALAQQLIAAELNTLGGANLPSGYDVLADIAAADALIGGNMIPPFGTDTLTTKQTSALVNRLTKYNEGRIAGAPRCK